jgi:hypothetical protein
MFRVDVPGALIEKQEIGSQTMMENRKTVVANTRASQNGFSNPARLTGLASLKTSGGGTGATGFTGTFTLAF